MLPRGQLSFPEQEVHELSLTRSIGLHEFGQVAVGARRRSGREQRADETVEIRLEFVERAGELRMTRSRPLRGSLKLGGETHRPGRGRVGAERTLHRKLDFSPA